MARARRPAMQAGDAGRWGAGNELSLRTELLAAAGIDATHIVSAAAALIDE